LRFLRFISKLPSYSGIADVFFQEKSETASPQFQTKKSGLIGWNDYGLMMNKASAANKKTK
jgi:hypothetical protein